MNQLAGLLHRADYSTNPANNLVYHKGVLVHTLKPASVLRGLCGQQPPPLLQISFALARSEEGGSHHLTLLLLSVHANETRQKQDSTAIATLISRM